MFALVEYYFKRSYGEWYENGWRFRSITYFHSDKEAIQALPETTDKILILKEDGFYYAIDRIKSLKYDSCCTNEEDDDASQFNDSYDNKEGVYYKIYSTKCIRRRYQIIEIPPGIKFCPTIRGEEDDEYTFVIPVEINESLTTKYQGKYDIYTSYVRKGKEVYDIVLNSVWSSFKGERIFIHNGIEKHCIEFLVEYLQQNQDSCTYREQDIHRFLDHITEEEEKRYTHEIDYLHTFI